MCNFYSVHLNFVFNIFVEHFKMSALKGHFNNTLKAYLKNTHFNILK